MIKQIAFFTLAIFCYSSFGKTNDSKLFTTGLEFPEFGVPCSSNEPSYTCPMRQLKAEIRQMKHILIKEFSKLKSTALTNTNNIHKLEQEVASLKKTTIGLQTLVKKQRTEIRRLSRLAHSHGGRIPPVPKPLPRVNLPGTDGGGSWPVSDGYLGDYDSGSTDGSNATGLATLPFSIPSGSGKRNTGEGSASSGVR